MPNLTLLNFPFALLIVASNTPVANVISSGGITVYDGGTNPEH